MQEMESDASRGEMNPPDDEESIETLQDSQPDNQVPVVTNIWKEKYIRLQADLENTKKRLARSSFEEVEAQKESLLRDLLPVADALDLALMHVSEEEDSRGILEGIDLIRDMLSKFFARHDVAAIEALGKPFDPRLHEGIGIVRNPKLPPHTVARVHRRGYMFGDRLLRPAQVLVTNG